MRNSKQGTICLRLLLVGVFCLLPQLLLAQDPNTQQPDNAPQQNPQPDNSTPPPPPAPGPQPIDTQIHPAGQAAPWLGTTSPLRWGDFSIGDFTYNYVRDDFKPAGGGPSADLSLDILRTTLVFQHYFGKQLLLLQYVPQLAVLNGKIAGNAGVNNEVALGTTFQLTPRFSLVIKDGFAQVKSRQLYPPNYLAVDQAGGNPIQSNFLQNAGSYLQNTVTAIGVYQVSVHDTLTFSSAYRYAHASGNNVPGQNVVVNGGQDFAESVAYTHQLTARQSIGGLYTLELLNQNGGAQVGQGTGTTYFNTVAGFYALQLSETLAFKSQLGANFTTYPNNTPPLRTTAGGFSFVKNFKNAQGNFAIAYTRGRTQDNFIAARVGDLIQAVYTQHLLRRLVWNSGAGYYRETGADPRNTGKTLDSGLVYEFAPRFFLSAQYAYLFQKADLPQLLSGTRNTVILGIKWEPLPLGPNPQ